MPTWNAGENVSSEYGGSSLALMSSSKNADAAYKFMEFASTNSDAIMSRVNQGGFPADLKTMSNDEFLNQTTMVNSDGDTVDYFGGEKFNAEFAEAAKHPMIKGFAVGRTIFGQPSRRWMQGELSDEALINEVKRNYLTLIGYWREARG